MAAVLEFAEVTVRRGEATLLDGISWTVEEDERWVVLGPNGAGKTTLLQVAAAQIHPTSGVAGILGEVLGTVDVFELRPRIGLTSAALAERIPRHEMVRDVVVSASYGVVGRWREEYDDLDHERADALLIEVGAEAPARPHLRHPQRGGAQAGPDRPRADDRPRAAAARRARRRPRPRRPRGPRLHPVGAGRRPASRRPPCWSPTTSRRSRRASPTRCCCATASVVAAGPVDEVIDRADLSATRSGCRCVLSHEDGRWAARRRVGRHSV